jgi:hypothetical protein
MDASVGTAPGAAPGEDLTLARLVPRPSRMRDAVLILAAVLLLAAAWGAPAVVSPEVRPAGMAQWIALASTRQVLTVTEVDLEAWPSATVVAVDPVAGAVPAGAWVIPGPWPRDDGGVTDGGWFGAGGGDSDGDGEVPADLRAEMTPRQALSQRLDPGLHRLVVLWEVENCDALSGAPPVVVLRGSLGVTTRRSLGATISGPAWDVALLRRSGICGPA